MTAGWCEMPVGLRELKLGSAVDAAPRARQFAVEVLAEAGLAELADDAVLAVAELVTNAQLHGTPPITVRLVPVVDGVRVEVSDCSRTGPVRAVDNVEAMTGRGLRLVSALAASWGVEPTAEGKVVWCELTGTPRPDQAPGGGLDDFDLDALLDAWVDDDAPTRFTVHLGDVPTELLLAAKAHIDNLVREFALAAGGARTGLSAAIPSHLVALIETVVQRFSDARQSIKRQAVAAASRGEPRTSLTLTLPLSSADAGEQYLAALDEADSYARAARLLTLEAPPAHKVFRRWYVEAIVSQLRAVAVGAPPPPIQTFEERLLAEIETVFAAHLASERAARLQSVTPALAAASTIDDVAAVVVNEGVNALDAFGGVLLVPTADGRLAVPGVVGYRDTIVAGLRAERIDAELPAAHALRTGEAVWLESQQERDSRFPSLVGLEPETVSLCAVPLIASGRTLGVLRFSFSSPRLFDADERRFVLALAAQTAQALDRSKLYGDAQNALARRDEVARTLQASVNACRDGVVAVGSDQRILAVNTQFFELWRLPAREIDPADSSLSLIRECMAQAIEPRAFETAIERGHERVDEVQEIDILLTNGRVITGYGAPLVEDGTYLGRVWYLREDTERRAAEKQRVELLDRLASVQRSQRFLLEASDVLAGASGFTETLERLATVAVPTLGDICLIDVVDEQDGIVRMAARHADPARQHLVDELHAKYPPDPRGHHPGASAIATGQALWAEEMSEEFLRATTHDDRHFEIVRELGFTSFITVPLIAEGHALGSVTVVSAGSGRRFGTSDVALAQELAGRVALVVAKARRYDRERELSHALQTSLLPAEVPHIEGLSVAVRYLAGTRDAEVGGDFYDVVRLPSGEVSLVIGDVAGHDVAAAAMMAELRSACRALGAGVDGPGALLHALNHTWDQLGLDRIATAVFGRLDPSTGRLRMASAGHLPPVVVHGDDARLAPLSPAGPLGAPPTDVVEWQGELPSGAALVFYTDGLVEDRQRDIDEGTDDLILAAVAARTTDPAALADHILASLVGDDRSDDVALLVIRRD